MQFKIMAMMFSAQLLCTQVLSAYLPTSKFCSLNFLSPIAASVA